MLPILQVFLLVCVYTVFSVEQGEGSTEIVEPKHKPIYVLNGTTFEMECNQYECKRVTWRKGFGEKEVEIDADFPSDFIITNSEKEVEIDADFPSDIIITNSQKADPECSFLTSTLKKLHVNISDADSYSCRLKDQADNDSNSFYTTVIVFTITPGDDELKMGKDATLKCEVGRLTKLPQVEWKKDGKVLKHGVKYSMNLTNNYLTIHDANQNDIGEYTCFFNLLEDSYSKVVNLWASPFGYPFDEKSMTYMKGSDMELKCNVWGHPTPVISWHKKQESDSLEPFDSDEVLEFSNIDYEKRGEYICRATNSFGKRDFSIIIRVKDSLAFLWPLIGIVIQLILLGIVIFIFEKRAKSNALKAESERNAQHVTNSTVHKSQEDVRHRK